MSNAVFRRARLACIPALLGMMGLAQPADAAVITRTFQFSATNFSLIVGSGTPPVATVIGSYTVTWDNAVKLVNQTTGITQNSLNIMLGSAPSWTYFVSGTMQIGGIANATGGVSFASSDFTLQFSGASTTPTFGNFVFSQALVGATFVSSTGTVSLVTAAPEPVSAVLLGSALVGLGLVRRRRIVRANQAAS